MSKRQTGSTLMFIGALLVGIAIFALVMVVMGTRLDQDVSPDPASPRDVARQELAAQAQAISRDADYGTYGEEWTAALGGVWVPWPDGAPEGYTNPPLPTVETTDANSALLNLSDAALGSDLGEVATSIGIAARSLGATNAEQCGDFSFAVVATVATTGLAVENIETARQWLEFDAAEKPYGERDSELARIDFLSDLTDAQLAAGAPDTRPPMVPEPEPGTAVQAAYKTVIDQLTFGAIHSDGGAEVTEHVTAFICHFNQFPDAPAIDALPGLSVATQG